MNRGSQPLRRRARVVGLPRSRHDLGPGALARWLAFAASPFAGFRIGRAGGVTPPGLRLSQEDNSGSVGAEAPADLRAPQGERGRIARSEVLRSSVLPAARGGSGRSPCAALRGPPCAGASWGPPPGWGEDRAAPPGRSRPASAPVGARSASPTSSHGVRLKDPLHRHARGASTPGSPPSSPGEVSGGPDRPPPPLARRRRPRLRREPSAPDCHSGARSALAVSHDFGGLLRTLVAGLFHPAADHGVRRVAGAPGHSEERSGALHSRRSGRWRPEASRARTGTRASRRHRPGSGVMREGRIRRRLLAGARTGRRSGSPLLPFSRAIPTGAVTLRSVSLVHSRTASPRPHALPTLQGRGVSTIAFRRPQGLAPCPSPLPARPVRVARARCSLGLRLAPAGPSSPGGGGGAAGARFTSKSHPSCSRRCSGEPVARLSRSRRAISVPQGVYAGAMPTSRKRNFRPLWFLWMGNGFPVLPVDGGGPPRRPGPHVPPIPSS